jgi:hypothetical protein
MEKKNNFENYSNKYNQTDNFDMAVNFNNNIHNEI